MKLHPFTSLLRPSVQPVFHQQVHFGDARPPDSFEVKNKKLEPDDPQNLKAIQLLQSGDVEAYNAMHSKLFREGKLLNFNLSAFEGYDFSGRDLKGADFTGAYLERANFSGANLELSSFVNATLRLCDFTNAKMKLCDFSSSDIAGSNFTQAELQNAIFKESGIISTKFNQANLNKSVFTKSNPMEGVDFTGANMTGALFNHLFGNFVTMIDVDLTDATLDSSDLAGNDFSGAVFKNTSLSGTDFKTAKFEGATIDTKALMIVLLSANLMGINKNLSVTGRGEEIYQAMAGDGSDFKQDRILEALMLDYLPVLMSDASGETRQYLDAFTYSVDRSWYRKATTPWVSETSGTHPLEAEMLLLWRHPRMMDFVKNLGLATSAPFDMKGKRVGSNNLGSTAVQNWQDIGLLAHDFKRWKFDARVGENGKTLLEDYGFQLIDWRPTDETFGKGYLLTKETNPFATMADETKIEFRRGYVLVTNPQAGTLVIRNSSKIFGRDLMAHPAYFSSESLSNVEIKNLVPNGDDRFTHIMDYPHYKTMSRQENIRFLLNELMSVRADYRRWKFDVSAKDGEGMSTAHLSPGFMKTLETARNLVIKQETDYFLAQMENLDAPPPKLLKLAFVDPEYPPYVPLGKADSPVEFVLNNDNLMALTQLIDPAEGEEAAYDPKLVAFLTQGVQYENAELLIM